MHSRLIRKLTVLVQVRERLVIIQAKLYTKYFKPFAK